MTLTEGAGRSGSGRHLEGAVTAVVMTFRDVAADLSEATGRTAGLADGRNGHVPGGVRRALGREPRDFTDYAGDVVAAGGWTS